MFESDFGRIILKNLDGFTPIINDISQTSIDSKCFYCGMTIVYSKWNDERYKINGKYICSRCLEKFCHSHNVRIEDILGE